VNYVAPATYSVASSCPEGGEGYYVTGSGSCTVTVPSGGYADIGVYWPYGIPYVTLTATSPSNVVTHSNGAFTASEAGDWTVRLDSDDPMVTRQSRFCKCLHSSNAFRARISGLLGTFRTNTGSGLSDGISWRDRQSNPMSWRFQDGRQGYQMSGHDGAMTAHIGRNRPVWA
jgi:hypothetical protein